MSTILSTLGARDVAFALKCTLAALLAVFIAASANLVNPGWAGLTVFLVSQPMAGASGAVATRVLYRVAGTLVGVAAALVIIPEFAGTPELLIGAMAGWIALCVFVSLLDRSPRSYAFVLSGYTVALVGLPLAATDPGSFFDIAVARGEEILLGGACAALVHLVIVPRSLKPALLGKVDRMLEDAERFILGGLQPQPAAASEQAARHAMAVDLSELRALAANLPIEAGVSAQDVAAVRALERHLIAILPLVTDIEERVSTLGPTEASSTAQVSWLLGEARRAIREGHAAAAAAGRADDRHEEALSDDDPAMAGIVQRLAELVQAWQDARALANRLRHPEAPTDVRVAGLMAEAVTRPLHVDAGLAAWSGLAAAASVIAASSLCWVLGWSQGVFAVGIASASSSIFASIDDPRPLYRILLTWTLIAIPVAALYAFAILPAVDGFVLFALALAPLFFLTGLFLGTARYWLPALGFALITQSLVSLQPVFSADFVSFIGVAIGTVFGSIVSLLVTSLVRVVSVKTSVWRLVRAGWRELARSSGAGSTGERDRRTSRMLDRVGMLLPRMAGAEGVARAKAATVLQDLLVGINVIDLREAARELGGPARAAVHDALKRVAGHFGSLLRHAEHASEPELLTRLEAAIATLEKEPPSLARRKALTAATGLRSGLFPAIGAPTGLKESTS